MQYVVHTSTTWWKGDATSPEEACGLHDEEKGLAPTTYASMTKEEFGVWSEPSGVSAIGYEVREVHGAGYKLAGYYKRN